MLVFFNFSAQIMLLGAEIARASLDMAEAEPGQRFRETDAIMSRLARFLRAKARTRLPAVVPGSGVAEDAAAPSGGHAPSQIRTADTTQTAERPGALSGLVLLVGLLVVAVLGFRKR